MSRAIIGGEIDRLLKETGVRVGNPVGRFQRFLGKKRAPCDARLTQTTKLILLYQSAF
jgi:hypothetical protein